MTEEKKSFKETKKEKTTSKDVEIPKKFKSLIEEIEKMSVIDLAELVKVLEEKFGVSTSAPLATVAAIPGAAGESQTEEKTEFSVELTSVGDNKIAVIKAIRSVTELGLKEAKDLVDAAPKVIKEAVKKEDAEKIKKVLEEAGAQVTLK